MLRKTRSSNTGSACNLRASMRPQHDAAENRLQTNPIVRSYGASMRPQHDAAENAGSRSGSLIMLEASMRPQHDAAENRLVILSRPRLTHVLQ